MNSDFQYITDFLNRAGTINRKAGIAVDIYSAVGSIWTPTQYDIKKNVTDSSCVKTIQIPDYANEVYKSGYLGFVYRLGNAFNNNPNLQFVVISDGLYGESWPATTEYYSTALWTGTIQSVRTDGSLEIRRYTTAAGNPIACSYAPYGGKRLYYNGSYYNITSAGLCHFTANVADGTYYYRDIIYTEVPPQNWASAGDTIALWNSGFCNFHDLALSTVGGANYFWGDWAKRVIRAYSDAFPNKYVYWQGARASAEWRKNVIEYIQTLPNNNVGYLPTTFWGWGARDYWDTRSGNFGQLEGAQVYLGDIPIGAQTLSYWAGVQGQWKAAHQIAHFGSDFAIVQPYAGNTLSSPWIDAWSNLGILPWLNSRLGKLSSEDSVLWFVPHSVENYWSYMTDFPYDYGTLLAVEPSTTYQVDREFRYVQNTFGSSGGGGTENTAWKNVMPAGAREDKRAEHIAVIDAGERLALQVPSDWPFYCVQDTAAQLKVTIGYLKNGASGAVAVKNHSGATVESSFSGSGNTFAEYTTGFSNAWEVCRGFGSGIDFYVRNTGSVALVVNKVEIEGSWGAVTATPTPTTGAAPTDTPVPTSTHTATLVPTSTSTHTATPWATVTPSTDYPVGWYHHQTENAINLQIPLIADGNWNYTNLYTWAPNLTGEYLDGALAEGIRVMLEIPRAWTGRNTDEYYSLTRIVGYVNTYKSHPALWGWYLADEPELHYTTDDWATPARLKEIYEAIRASDPNHPVTIIHYGNASGVQYEGVYFREAYSTLMIDWYPRDAKQGEADIGEFNWMLRASPLKWQGGRASADTYGKGFIAVLLGNDQSGVGTIPYPRELTADEYRYYIYSAVASGPDAMLFWEWKQSNSSVRGKIQAVTDEMATIIDRMVAGSTGSGSGVTCSASSNDMLYRYGAVGADYAIVAINIDGSDNDNNVNPDTVGAALSGVMFTLPPGVRPAEVTVLGESRTVSVNGSGEFTDDFARYATHIYTFTLGGATATPTLTPTSTPTNTHTPTPTHTPTRSSAVDCNLTVSGGEIRAQGTPITLIGYGNYDLITDTGLNYSAVIDALYNYDINLLRLFAMGYYDAYGDNDDIMPFTETSTPNRYNLASYNSAYFTRLDSIISYAASKGIVVQLTLFDHAIQDSQMTGPWCNNSQELSVCYMPEFYRLSSYPTLASYQQAYVEKMVSETAEHWNVIYEVMNEAREGTAAEISSWHQSVIGWINSENPYALVSASATQENSNTAHSPNSIEVAVNSLSGIDIISLHYHAWRQSADCTSYGCGCSSMGGLNSNRQWEYCMPWPLDDTRWGQFDKPIIFDDDGAYETADDGFVIREVNGRVDRWADRAVLLGGHFNHKDSITALDNGALGALQGAGPSDLISICSLGDPTATPTPSPTSTPSSHAGEVIPYLFIDDFYINTSGTTGVTRVVDQPERHRDGPVIGSAFLDSAFENGEHDVKVIYDPEDTSAPFKLWYRRLGEVSEDLSINIQDQFNYTTSIDGEGWTTPIEYGSFSPDAVSYNNSNVSFTEDPNTGGYYFISPDGTDPGVTFFRAKLDLYKSINGFNWVASVNNPIVSSYVGEWGEVFWDVNRSRWGMLLRYNLLPCSYTDVNGTSISPPGGWCRTVSYATNSTVDGAWSGIQSVFVPGALDDGDTQFYMMSNVLQRGVYRIATMGVQKDQEKAADTPSYMYCPNYANMESRRVYGIGYTVLTWSADGDNWSRDYHGDKFFEPINGRLPNGSLAFDNSHTWMHELVEVGDEIYAYYGGYMYGHKIYCDRSIGLVKFLMDRFVARHAGNTQGVLKTKPMVWQGAGLYVNVNAVGGYLDMEVQNTSGAVLYGFSRTDCGDVTTDGVNTEVSCTRPFEDLIGQNVVFRFFLRNADLYAFYAAGAEGPPIPPTATPTPTRTPIPGSTVSTFYPAKDALLLSSLPDNNYGAGTTTSVSAAGRTIQQFDLSSIPSGATISSATLVLTKVNRTADAMAAGFYKVTRNWVEAQVTYSSASTGVSWTAPGGDIETAPEYSVSVPVGDGTWTVDVTNLVRGWVASPGTNYGAVIKRDSGSGITNLRSREHASAPRLSVTWIPPIATATPTSTATRTPTGVAPTNTPTRTPTATPISSEEVYTLSPIQDSFVYSTYPDTNLGTSAVVKVSNIASGLYEWDLSSVPSNAQVLDATLNFHIASKTDGDLQARIYGITRAWNEYQVTYNSAMNAVGWSEPGGDTDPLPAYTVLLPNSVGPWNTDVTELVADWVGSPDENHGILIEWSSGGSRADLTSREAVLNRPSLTVTWRPGTAENTATPTPTPVATGTPRVTIGITPPVSANVPATWMYRVEVTNSGAAESGLDFVFVMPAGSTLVQTVPEELAATPGGVGMSGWTLPNGMAYFLIYLNPMVTTNVQTAAAIVSRGAWLVSAVSTITPTIVHTATPTPTRTHTWTPTPTWTPGGPTATPTRTPTATTGPWTSGPWVVFNEVLPLPNEDHSYDGEINLGDQGLEIYNRSDYGVNMRNWYFILYDKGGRETKRVVFPAEFTLEGNGFWVARPKQMGVYLATDRGTAKLYNSSGVLQDEIGWSRYYSDADRGWVDYGVSWGRLPDGWNSWSALDPSPGYANTTWPTPVPSPTPRS
uniref:LTD domain-containing protein n=1 Tax=viral metagenome TaxID=1070528 RepID=A0A6M3XD09_9ZZZZ